MSFIGAEDDAFVTCEDTTRSIRDYLENTQVLLSGTINREDGNYNNNNCELNIRIVSCSEVQEFIFINSNNNIVGTCLNRGRVSFHLTSMKSISLDIMHAAIFLYATSYMKP